MITCSLSILHRYLPYDYVCWVLYRGSLTHKHTHTHTHTHNRLTDRQTCYALSFFLTFTGSQREVECWRLGVGVGVWTLKGGCRCRCLGGVSRRRPLCMFKQKKIVTRRYVCVCVCVCTCMYVCMYVYIYIYI